MLVYIHRDMIQGTHTWRHNTQAYIDMIQFYIHGDKIHMYLYGEIIYRHIHKET